MMRECRNMLKLIGAAHGIGNMEDKRTVEVERRKRMSEKETEREKGDSLRATVVAKRRGGGDQANPGDRGSCRKRLGRAEGGNGDEKKGGSSGEDPDG